MATINKMSKILPDSKKRKLISDSNDSDTDSNKSVSYRSKKVHKTVEEFEFNDISSSNKKKMKIPLLENEKRYNRKSLETMTSNENRINYENKEDDDDKKVELQVWHYLLHHLEDSEKLIALKLLMGITKMKENWKENHVQKKYVDSKIVEDLQLVIRTLKYEQEENEKEKKLLLKEKSELQKKLSEERKCRIQLAQALASTCENYQTKLEETKCVQVNKQSEVKTNEMKEIINTVENRKLPSVSNSKDIKNEIKKEPKVEQDLRNVLNNRENGGNREHRNNYNSQFIPNIHPIMLHHQPHFVKENHRILNGEMSLIIKSNFRQNFSQIVKMLEHKMQMPLCFNKVIPYNGHWEVECMTRIDKANILNRKYLLKGSGVLINCLPIKM